MKIIYSCSKEDFLTYQLFQSNQNKRIKRKRLIDWLIVPVVFFTMSAIYYSSYRKIEFTILLLAITGACWLFFYWYIQRWVWKRHYLKYVLERYSYDFDKPCTIEITDKYVLISDEKNKTKIDLTEIEIICELSDYYLASLKSKLTIIIPKKNIEKQLLIEFIKLLCEKTGKTVIDKTKWKWK